MKIQKEKLEYILIGQSLLNEGCEDYRMKINISKTKAMVIGRKPKKINIRIEGKSIEQVDSSNT